MADDREERIRKRAYELWERDGSPEGQNDSHWHEAAREVDAQMQDESRSAGDTGPEPEVHKSDEDNAGPGSPEAPSSAKGAATDGEAAKKPARKAATKTAAKTTKAPARSTKPRKPRAKKDEPPGSDG